MEKTLMIRRVIFALTMPAMMLGAACGSSPTVGTSTPTPVSAAPSSQPTPSSQPSVASTTDPCQVVTVSEAASLTGASYGPGKEETDSGGGQICVYGYQTLNVFMVLIATAPDAGSAQAQWTQQESKAQALLQQSVSQVQGLNVSLSVNDVTLTGADKAAVGTASATYGGRTFAAAAVYLLKGPVFLSFSDLVVDHPAPSASAMQSEAQTALGRLP
jgi:hypothetical protein